MSESTKNTEVAAEVVTPPEDAQFIHGSGATRFYTGEDKPDYLPIDDGETLTVVNINELALRVPHAVNTVDVHGAPARGLPIFTTGTDGLGADLLFVPPGESFPLHVHPGHHFLLSVGGLGSVTFAGKVHTVRPGDLYCIQAEIPHAVGSDPDGPGHWLISFGSPHKRVDSHDRMTSLDSE